MKRILVSSHASLFPPEHGGAKNVQYLLESLADIGVECRVLVKMHPLTPNKMRFAGQHNQGLDAFRHDFRNWKSNKNPNDFCSWTYRNIQYKGVLGESDDLARASRQELEQFKPDAFILCDDSLDEGKDLFDVAAKSGKFVFLAQTIHSLPFGPYSMRPSAAVTSSIKKATQIIAPSCFVKNYIENHLGTKATVFYPNVFGKVPFPKLGNFRNPYITMINPCPWKGSSILIKLAKFRPDLLFATVPTWGATPDLIKELNQLENLTLLEETPEIDTIFSQTKVLIAPSLCQEAFGLVSPEALLRGIPVIASDIAGLRESTLGVAQLIPVTPLPFDNPREGTDHTKFVWTEPENPIEPWSRAIDGILKDENNYQRVSENVKNVAEKFVNGLRNRPILSLLFSNA